MFKINSLSTRDKTNKIVYKPIEAISPSALANNFGLDFENNASRNATLLSCFLKYEIVYLE